MTNLHLYAVAVAIWGSTWLAIKFQLGIVPPSVSVVWRFALASAILFVYAGARRLPLKFAPREHAFIAMQGTTMFGVNYIGVYMSEQYLTSGLVAVISSLLAFFNIAAMRMFYGAPLEARTILGSIIGIAGVALVFWPSIADTHASSGEWLGVAFVLGAAMVASLGSVAATRNSRAGIAVVPLNAFAMGYGAAIVAIIAALSGEALAFDWSLSYVASLAYLSFFGSVLAFGAYLTLMARIGAQRAGYAAIAVPVLALLLSTFFENLQWTAAMVLGLALCLGGNWLVLSRRSTPKHDP
jgi:drug/metabolite transporter (DMT)-like permease